MFVELLSKRKFLYYAFSAIVVIAIVSFLLLQSKPNEPNPQPVLESYLNSIKEGNIDKMITYVNDTRYKNAADLKKFYERQIKLEKLLDYKIIQVTKDDATHFKILTSLKFDQQNDSNQTFTLVKQDREWKILILPRGQ